MKIKSGIHQPIMKPILLLFITFISYFNSAQETYKDIFGDSIKKIQWSSSLTYLPTLTGEYGVIHMTSSKIKSENYEYIMRFRRFRRKKRSRNKISKDQISTLYKLNAKWNQPIVKIKLTEDDKDSMRLYLTETTYYGEKAYKIPLKTIESYLLLDSIDLDMSVFARDSFFTLHGIVIDGAGFRFQQMYITHSGDTTVNNFDGNLYGSERFREYPEYLKYSCLIREGNLYAKMPFEQYFLRSKYLRIILEYIEVREGYRTFNPMRLYDWED